MATKHPLQTKLAILLLPFSWVYRALMFFRTKAYDCGIFKKYASEVPTLCIGNISWGGTGKSPLIDYLASALQNRKKKCVILTRGYKSDLPSYPFLLNSLTLQSVQQEKLLQEKHKTAKNLDTNFHKNTSKELIDENIDEDIDEVILPDESVMLLHKHPHLEIIISADRVLGAKRVSAFANLAKSKQSHLTEDHSKIALEPNPAHIYADFLLMDDGFQHLKLCADYNFVLLDKDDFYPHDFVSALFSKTYSWNSLIPLGTWREPRSALKRADIFLVKCPREEWEMIREYAILKLSSFKKPLFVFEIAIESLDYVFQAENEETNCDIESLKETHIPYTLLCAIANPKQLEDSITHLLGYAPSKTIFLPDHFNYQGKNEDLWAALNEMPVICTEKDAAKLTYKKNLQEAKYPLLFTRTKLEFYDSAFYDSGEEIKQKYDNEDNLHTDKMPHHQDNAESKNNKHQKEFEASDIICCQLKQDIYKQHEEEFSQSIADVLKPVDPYTLEDEFDPEYYKYQLHNTPIFPCHKKLANRFARKAPKIVPSDASDFEKWLEHNIFTISPKTKLYKDYIS